MSNAWRMGDLAGQDYYDPMTGIPVGQTSSYDPREAFATSPWARTAMAHPEAYEPQVGMFPNYTPPDETSFRQRFAGGAPTELPDIGKATIPSGPSWQGSERANRAADAASQLAADVVLPHSATDVGMMLMPGGLARKAVGGAIGSLFSSDPAEAGMSKLFKGIRAYHSSPHDFDRFDLTKIGTGEGAQVRGHGFYFAENPQVSGQGGDYWNQFQSRFAGPEGTASELLRQSKFDREAAILAARERVEKQLATGNPSAQWLDDQKRVLGLLQGGNPVGPRTYEVNIKTSPDKLVNLDASVGAQSPYVEERLRALGIRPQEISVDNTRSQAMGLLDQIRGVKGYAPWVAKDLDEIHAAVQRATRPDQIWADMRDIPAYYGIPGGKTGGWIPEGNAPTMWDAIAPDVHKRLAEMRASLAPQPIQERIETSLGGRVRAADALRDVEIPGSRYFDAGSRNIRGDAMPDATSNYVINDPRILDIAKKYGVVGAPAGTLGALAARDKYQPEEKL